MVFVLDFEGRQKSSNQMATHDIPIASQDTFTLLAPGFPWRSFPLQINWFTFRRTNFVTLATNSGAPPEVCKQLEPYERETPRSLVYSVTGKQRRSILKGLESQKLPELLSKLMRNKDRMRL